MKKRKKKGEEIYYEKRRKGRGEKERKVRSGRLSGFPRQVNRDEIA